MSSIRLKHASGNSMSLAAPGTNPASNLELKLPHTIGSANQLLKVDGSGQLGWATDNSGVSLSGSTNNTIATVTGANALIGESELTYTGGLLKVAAGYPTFYLDDTTTTNNRFRLTHNNELTQFEADPNNVYSNSRIQFDIDGSERLRITSDGKLGVGDSSPSVSAIFQRDQTTHHYLRVENLNSNSNYTAFSLKTPQLDFQLWNQGPGGSGYGGANSVNFYQGAATGPYCFFHGTAERLRINTNGNVGIGTTSPNSKLQVASGHINIDSGYSFQWGDSHERIEQSDGKIEFFTGNGEKMTLSGSNLGIGTSSPATTLHLDSTGTPTTIQIDSDTESSIDFNDHGGSAKRYKIGTNLSDNNGQFEIKDITASAERLRIKSDGDIEVGGNLKTNNLAGRNLIINGEFAIWQRGTTSINMSQNKYLTDRFKAMSSTDGDGSIHQHANVPTQVQTGGSQFPYSLRVNCTTADTSLAAGQYITINHRIEGYNLRQLGFGLAGTRYATLSFWQRSPSGTYHVAFRNNAYNRYYIGSYTAASNTWEKHVITIPIDTSGTWESGNSMGLDIQWSLGCGSNNSGGTVGSWSSGSKHAGSSQKNFYDTVGNDFYLTGVQFEKGSITTQFEHRSYGEELNRCYRYCELIVGDIAGGYISNSVGYTTDQLYAIIRFKIEKRDTPTLQQTTGTNYYQNWHNNAGTYLNGFSGVSWANKWASGIYTTSAVAAKEAGLLGAASSNARLLFISEL